MTVSFNIVPDWSQYKLLDGQKPAGITVHRIDPGSIPHPAGGSYENSARGVYDFFMTHPDGRRVSGSSMPFSLVIAGDGSVEQSLPLDRRTNHTSGLDASHLGIACLGDFREHAMPAAQLGALVGLCAHIADRAGFAISEVIGHTETSRGSRHWRTLDSPGRKVDMQSVREAAMASQKEREASGAPWELLWNAKETRAALADVIG